MMSGFDGEDLAATLLGKASKISQLANLLATPARPSRFRSGMDEDNPDLAVRDGKWKYLVNYDGSDPQLYDLDSDVSESNNLATEQKEVVARLHQAVMNWNAGLPVDAGDPDWEGNASPSK